MVCWLIVNKNIVLDFITLLSATYSNSNRKVFASYIISAVSIFLKKMTIVNKLCEETPYLNTSILGVSLQLVINLKERFQSEYVLQDIKCYIIVNPIKAEST
jgi:hypothetical protein